MNTRLFSVLAAAISLSLSAGFVAPTHAAPVSAGVGQHKLAEAPRQNRLNLTDDQKNQMKQIQQQAEQQIQGILNDSQKAQLQNAGSDWKARRQAWSQINQTLSEEQKNQIKQIRQQGQQQIYSSVFTDAQRQQVDAWKQQRRARQQQQGS